MENANALGPSVHGDELPQESMSRQTLMKRDIQTLALGAEVRVIRVEFPPGFKIPLHTHNAEGPRYVVKGHLRVEDQGKPQTYGPGDSFWETGSPMTIENISGSDAEMIILKLQKPQPHEFSTLSRTRKNKFMEM